MSKVLYSTYAPEPGQQRLWFKHNVVRRGKRYVEVAVNPDGIADDDMTDRLDRGRLESDGYDVVLEAGAAPRVYFTASHRLWLEATGNCPEVYGEKALRCGWPWGVVDVPRS